MDKKLTITIFQESVNCSELCFEAMALFNGWNQINHISIEELGDKDGFEAVVVVDWKIDSQALRDYFNAWCMQSFNRHAEIHKVNGKEI
jgi:hypothetical protein